MSNLHFNDKQSLPIDRLVLYRDLLNFFNLFSRKSVSSICSQGQCSLQELWSKQLNLHRNSYMKNKSIYNKIKRLKLDFDNYKTQLSAKHKSSARQGNLSNFISQSKAIFSIFSCKELNQKIESINEDFNPKQNLFCETLCKCCTKLTANDKSAIRFELKKIFPSLEFDEHLENEVRFEENHHDDSDKDPTYSIDSAEDKFEEETNSEFSENLEEEIKQVSTDNEMPLTNTAKACIRFGVSSRALACILTAFIFDLVLFIPSIRSKTMNLVFTESKITRAFKRARQQSFKLTQAEVIRGIAFDSKKSSTRVKSGGEHQKVKSGTTMEKFDNYTVLTDPGEELLSIVSVNKSSLNSIGDEQSTQASNGKQSNKNSVRILFSI